MNNSPKGPGRQERETHTSTSSYEAIAEQAGVSRSTVSRVLRNDPRISESTAGRVREAARKLGYRPNPLLSALMERIRAGRKISYQGVIAVITESESPAQWFRSNSSWEEIHEGAAERAEEQGYHFEYFSTRDYPPDGRRLTQILRTRGIHGVYVTPGFAERRVRLDWSEFSAATTGYGLAEPQLHRVCYSNYHGIQLACARLRALGYRRIGLFLEQRNDAVTDHGYLAGFLLYLESVSAAARIRPHLAPKYTRESFLSWLKRERPDAVVSSADEALAWAKESGRECPRDFGFVHLDRSARRTRFAGIYHNSRLMGRGVIDLIIAQIYRGETGIPEHPLTTLVEGVWSDGPSVAGGEGAYGLAAEGSREPTLRGAVRALAQDERLKTGDGVGMTG